MTIYDEQLPVLDDEFQGDEVALLATRGRTVDGNFRRSYAWAKHAADQGKLSKITVVVAVDSTDQVHTVDAVKSALSGVELHGVAQFSVEPVSESYSRIAGEVREALKELEPQGSGVEPELSAELPEIPVDEVAAADSAPVIDWRALQNQDTQEV